MHLQPLLGMDAFIYETPAHRPGEVSMLTLDEYVALLELPGVKHVVGAQCPFGGLAAKLTSWVYNIVDLSDMPTQ